MPDRNPTTLHKPKIPKVTDFLVIACKTTWFAAKPRDMRTIPRGDNQTARSPHRVVSNQATRPRGLPNRVVLYHTVYRNPIHVFPEMTLRGLIPPIPTFLYL
jgi:hypothetical protein